MMRQYELVERVRRYNPNADEDLLNRAYVFAMKAHGTQKRASGDPYFSHPLEVAAILTELKVDDATIVAAMLHDTIEDTAITREDVDKAFGEEIGGFVDGLTKLGKLDFVTKHAQQAENFRKLLLAIADAARGPHGHAEHAQRTRGPVVPLPDAGRLRADRVAPRGAEGQERRDHRAHRGGTD